MSNLIGICDKEYPILGDGTTQNDLDEALWVMRRAIRILIWLNIVDVVDLQKKIQ